MRILDDLERFAHESLYPDALESIRDARAGIEKLMNKMDTLEAGFDRIAERSCKFMTSNNEVMCTEPRNSVVIV